MSTHPTITEIETNLRKILFNILESAKAFWRWKDGYCTFCEQIKGPNDEMI